MPDTCAILILNAGEGGITLFLGRLHPLLVHLPIGILLLSLLLAWLSRTKKYAALKPAVPFTLLAGAVSAVAACIAGYLLSLSGGYDSAMLALHQWLGIGTAATALGCWLLYRRAERMAYPALFVLFILLNAAGHFGGSLTHGPDYLSRSLPAPVRDLLGIELKDDFKAPLITDVQEAAVYEDIIRPVFAQRCQSCHGADKQEGEFRLDTKEFLMQGGEGGAVLSAGAPGESELYRRLTLPEDHDERMPPEGRTPPTPEQIKLIHWWISSGAPFDQQVKELSQPDTIKPLLTGLQSGGGKRENLMIPEDTVEAAHPDSLRGLLNTGVSVMTVSDESHYLQVNAVNSPEFGDGETGLLLPLSKQLIWLKLGNTRLSDKGLANIARLENLTRLHLEHTQVSDAGLEILASCKKLRYLNLFNTQVSDTGLQHLEKLPALQEVYLYQTDVTPGGVADIQKKNPSLKIDTGSYRLPFLASDTVDHLK